MQLREDLCVIYIPQLVQAKWTEIVALISLVLLAENDWFAWWDTMEHFVLAKDVGHFL